jgi:starch phosphorylase
MGSKVETNGASGSLVSAKVPAVANPLAEKPDEIASNISYHAQYSPHFSAFKFELEQAYYATAESVRDRLVQVYDDDTFAWNWDLYACGLVFE